MRSKTELTSIFTAVCVSVFLSLPAFARPSDPRQDQGAAQTQSGPQDKKHKAGTSPSKDVGDGSKDVGKGAAKGAGSLGKGTVGAAGNLATLQPGHAAADLGKGAGGAAKDVGVGAGKGAAKFGEGSAKGIGKLGGKIFHRGSDSKEKTDRAGTT